MFNLNDPWIVLFVFLACVVAPILLVIGGALLAGGIIVGRRSALKSAGRAAPAQPAAARANKPAPVPAGLLRPADAPVGQPPARDVAVFAHPAGAPQAPSAATAQPMRSSPAAQPVTRPAHRSPSSAPTVRRSTAPQAPGASLPAVQPAPVPGRCPQCGYSNRPGAHFCANCRRDLSALASLEPAAAVRDEPALEAPAPVEAPAAQESKRDAFCWNCGQALRPTSRFCPRCGSPV